MMANHSIDSPHLLRGGGEAGDLIRKFDWASTPLGLMETWLSATAYSTYRDAVAFGVLRGRAHMSNSAC